MASKTPLLGLPYLYSSQAQKDVTVNQSLTIIDSFLQPTVKSASTTTPPSSPSDQDKYIVPAGAGGVWATHVGAVAVFQADSVAWTYFTPQAGWVVYVQDAPAFYAYSGSSWGLVGLLFGSHTVTALPSAATAGIGSRAFVSDANATLAAGIGTTVASGGSNKVPVYSDGTNWLIG